MIASLYQRGSVALAIFFTLLLSVLLGCAFHLCASSLQAAYAEDVCRLNARPQRNIIAVLPRVGAPRLEGLQRESSHCVATPSLSRSRVVQPVCSLNESRFTTTRTVFSKPGVDFE